MIKVKIKQKCRSIPKDVQFELPKLAVLIGKNGSGKTHLFEALAKPKDLSDIRIGEKELSEDNVRFLRFGEMVPQVGSDTTASELNQMKKNLWAEVEQYIREFKEEQKKQGGYVTASYFLNNHISNRDSPRIKELIKQLESICSKLNKNDFTELTEEDLIQNCKLERLNDSGILGAQLARVFKDYQQKFIDNEFLVFLKNRYPDDEDLNRQKSFSSGDFIEEYGRAPWERINEILRMIRLPFQFVPPVLLSKTFSYDLKLIGDDEKEVKVEALSTGEKVLLSVMLAMYNTEHNSELVNLIIIDEPDAALHPDFSKSLMDCLKKITETTNISVLISSHSPSTVALCPEGSVFLMEPQKRCPEPISVNKGIKALTEGLPYLKVGINNVCPIFVEGKDAEIYNEFFELASKSTQFDYAPVFIKPRFSIGPAGKNKINEANGQATEWKIHSQNKVEVIETVQKLKNSNVTNILGIVDWDTINEENMPLFILGGGRRYAIENYVYDPIFIGLALIDLKPEDYSFEDFGITDVTRFEDAYRLSQNDLQKIIDWVFKQLGDAQKLEVSFEQDEKVPCILQNQFKVYLPKSNFLQMNGHGWEKLIVREFICLKEIKKSNHKSLMLSFTEKYIKKFPDFLSADIAEMFTNIQAYIQAQTT